MVKQIGKSDWAANDACVIRSVNWIGQVLPIIFFPLYVNLDSIIYFRFYPSPSLIFILKASFFPMKSRASFQCCIFKRKMDSANELLTFQPASQNDIAVNGVLLSSVLWRQEPNLNNKSNRTQNLYVKLGLRRCIFFKIWAQVYYSRHLIITDSLLCPWGKKALIFSPNLTRYIRTLSSVSDPYYM